MARAPSDSPQSIERAAATDDPCENVGRWPARWAAMAGGRRAIVDADRVLDWATFELRVARTAGWLRSTGIGRGDRVASLLGNRTANLELVFACARIAAIVVPMNLRLSPHEIAFMLDDCAPGVLFVEQDLVELARDASSHAGSPPQHVIPVGGSEDAWEATLAGADRVQACEPVSPETPMILMYTSGTTGKPKGALLPHRKALFNSLNAQLAFGTRADDCVLVAAPLFHSLGLQILSLPAVYAGACLVLHARFDPERIVEAIERQGITYLGGVPAMHQRLYDLLETRPDLAPIAQRLRFVFSAGAAISVELIRAFSRLGVVIKQGYGQTETSTLTCLDDADSLARAGSVGRPVFHAELRVVPLTCIEQAPATWRDARVGEHGEICVRGPITMLGYWRRPEATAETIRDGWLRTGDLARVDDEGFVYLVGRARDLIITGGENVYPAEVEAVFREHPAIRDVAIVGVADARWGEVGRAHVVLEEARSADSEAWLAWAGERLARFKLPKAFVIEEDLPRTASGKVQKHLLGTSGSSG